MENCKPLTTHCPSTSTSAQPFYVVDVELYHSLVGSLQPITIKRLDVIFLVNKACQNMYALIQVNWAELKHLLRYLKRTITHELQLNKHSSNIVLAYLNAHWAVSFKDRQSIRGYLVYLGFN